MFMLFCESGNLALRSLAIQGSQSWGIQHLLSRLSVLLRLQFRGKLEPVQVSHRSTTVQFNSYPSL